LDPPRGRGEDETPQKKRQLIYLEKEASGKDCLVEVPPPLRGEKQGRGGGGRITHSNKKGEALRITYGNKSKLNSFQGCDIVGGGGGVDLAGRKNRSDGKKHQGVTRGFKAGRETPSRGRNKIRLRLNGKKGRPDKVADDKDRRQVHPGRGHPFTTDDIREEGSRRTERAYLIRKRRRRTNGTPQRGESQSGGGTFYHSRRQRLSRMKKKRLTSNGRKK